MNAETIAKALGGRKAGGGWTARCPAHDDREPRASQSATRTTARCWCAAMRAATRSASSQRCAGAACGQRTVRARFSRTARRTPVEHRARSTTMPDAARRRSPSGNPRSRHRERWSRPISRRAGSICRRPTRCGSMPALKHPSGGYLAGNGGAGDDAARTERRSPSTAPFSPATAAGRRRSTHRR